MVSSIRFHVNASKYILEKKGRAMHERIKEHDRDIRFARTQNSPVSEHANETGQAVDQREQALGTYEDEQ